MGGTPLWTLLRLCDDPRTIKKNHERGGCALLLRPRRLDDGHRDPGREDGLRERDLRRLIVSSLPQVHWQSIETGGTGRGVPDLNGCWLGVEFWIELKHVARGRKVALSPVQAAWIARRLRAGGRAFILARYRQDILLWRGSSAASLMTQGIDLPPVASWPVRNLPWDQLLSHLTR